MKFCSGMGSEKVWAPRRSPKAFELARDPNGRRPSRSGSGPKEKATPAGNGVGIFAQKPIDHRAKERRDPSENIPRVEDKDGDRRLKSKKFCIKNFFISEEKQNEQF